MRFSHQALRMMHHRKRRILLTGCAGFVGSRIAARLLREEHSVLGLDDLSGGVSFTPEGVAHSHIDLSSRRSIEEIADICSGANRPDVIVHAAARADISRNWARASGGAERQALMRANVQGTHHLLEGLHRAAGAPLVIYLSTAAVYGDNPHASELSPPNPNSPYAATKLAGEALVQAFGFHWGASPVILRLASCVGANYHHGHIADFVAQMRVGKAIAPAGPFSPKPFVHVDDVADIVAHAVAASLGSGVYNVAGGSWSPADTITLMGLPQPVAWGPGWSGDPCVMLAADKLFMTGWRPRPIAAGVRDALAGLGWGKGKKVK